MWGKEESDMSLSKDNESKVAIRDFSNNERTFPLRYNPRSRLRPVIAVESYSASDYIAAVKKDGTVIVNQSLIKEDTVSDTITWTKIVSIAIIDKSVVGLREDGSVVATGAYKQIVQGWKHVISIHNSNSGLIGLCSNGSVMIGIKEGKSGKTEILLNDKIAFISSLGRPSYDDGLLTSHFAHAIQKDGTLCRLGFGNSFEKEDEQKIKKGIHTIEIRGDYNIMQLDDAGRAYYNSEALINWGKVSRIFYSSHWLAGLREDGTVIAKFHDEKKVMHSYGKETEPWIISEVRKWKNIMEIALGYDFILGLNEDGLVLRAFKEWYTKKDVGLIFTNIVDNKRIDRPWLTELDLWNLFS